MDLLAHFAVVIAAAVRGPTSTSDALAGVRQVHSRNAATLASLVESFAEESRLLDGLVGGPATDGTRRDGLPSPQQQARESEKMMKELAGLDVTAAGGREQPHDTQPPSWRQVHGQQMSNSTDLGEEQHHSWPPLRGSQAQEWSPRRPHQQQGREDEEQVHDGQPAMGSGVGWQPTSQQRQQQQQHSGGARADAGEWQGEPFMPMADVTVHNGHVTPAYPPRKGARNNGPATPAATVHPPQREGERTATWRPSRVSTPTTPILDPEPESENPGGMGSHLDANGRA